MDDSRIAIIGKGRAGRAFAAAARAAGIAVHGPLGRTYSIESPIVTLLCVPDRALGEVAASLPAGLIVGHCSASSTLDVLAPHEAFSLHPLLSLQGEHSSLKGAWAATDGTTVHAQGIAESLARRLGMNPMHVPGDKRALYHAAASVAANYLVTLEDTAERLAGVCGVPREALLPLVESALRAWGEHGFASAITGPIARGDLETAAKQRDAVAAALPDALPLFDVMAKATRDALVRTATEGA